MKSKIFISCGQAENAGEREIAHAVAANLLQLGFEPYIAVAEQSLLGLKENIFKQLESSEYLIFIDFKRERISNSEFFRGSLFSHQELALASYLELPIIAFQESGVKREDGLMHFLQGNATQFTDRHLLADVIGAQVRARGWRADWKNKIEIQPEIRVQDAIRLPEKKAARFFHIQVRNLHLSKAARNCYAYLDSAFKLRDAQRVRLPVETIEFKWAGYTLPNATILPGSSRYFDAFFQFHDSPGRANFNVYSDSTAYVPLLPGAGKYELCYKVISDNFPEAKAIFLLDIGGSYPLTRLSAEGGDSRDPSTHGPAGLSIHFGGGLQNSTGG